MKYAKTCLKLFNKNEHARFIFLIIISVIITHNANCQTKSIDLYDLIRSSVPDSSATENVTDWQNGISINPVVKWVNNKPKKSMGYYYKDGGGRVKSSNKKFEHVEIFLRGNTLEGYSEIRLKTSWGEGYAIEKLIGNKPYTITLLKKDVSGLPNYVNDYYYKLKLPGKKDVWVISESNINRNDNYKFALYIRIIFDYEAFKSEAAL